MPTAIKKNRFETTVPMTPSEGGAVDLIELTNTDTGTNINGGTVAIPWGRQVVKVGEGQSWSVSNNTRITLAGDGIREIYVNIAKNTSVQRQNETLRIRKNGTTYLHGRGTSGYIRSASGHNDASNSLRIIEDFADGDYIEVISENESNGGTATMRDEGCVFSVKKLT